MTEQQLNDLLKGYRIAEVRRVLDLIMFEFEDQNEQSIYLHTECFVKIATKDKILLSSYDLYEPKFPSAFCLRNILNIKFSFFDMDIYLSDNIVIRLIPNTLEKNREQLILFNDDKTYLWLWTAEEGEIIDVS